MKKSILSLVIFGLLAAVIAAPAAMAHCPVCTIGAGAGIGIARAWGINDSIVGLFIGALIASSALWFNKWLKKKVNFSFQETLLVVGTFLMFVVPFYFSGMITNFEMVKSMPTHHAMTGLGMFGLAAFGVDLLLFGIIIGNLAIWGVFSLSESIKKARSGKVLWQFQGLSFMFITLAILSLAFWLLTRTPAAAAFGVGA